MSRTILSPSLGVSFRKPSAARSSTGCRAFVSDQATGSATRQEFRLSAWMKWKEGAWVRAKRLLGRINAAMAAAVDFRKWRRLNMEAPWEVAQEKDGIGGVGVRLEKTTTRQNAQRRWLGSRRFEILQIAIILKVVVSPIVNLHGAAVQCSILFPEIESFAEVDRNRVGLKIAVMG
jgi:hypothetical protein